MKDIEMIIERAISFFHAISALIPDHIQIQAFSSSSNEPGNVKQSIISSIQLSLSLIPGGATPIFNTKEKEKRSDYRKVFERVRRSHKTQFYPSLPFFKKTAKRQNDRGVNVRDFHRNQ
ncbi:hypothetical protein EYC84_003590 [Monilinia fructicola]|uniref:Uncharacterized protein n=1 Tax=Monilinia fructicola TaxID=38448 RepID=A0A5M9JX51_MONFR|nr:hypothetical protein EYC84_003590 [Monilinia fructicola]